jgi:hypothetical protein
MTPPSVLFECHQLKRRLKIQSGFHMLHTLFHVFERHASAISEV